jgi:hypothetical protein
MEDTMIKRIALLLSALTLALTLSLGMLATADSAGAAPGDENVAKLCQMIVAEGGFPGTQGACVALVTTENFTPLIASLCQSEEFRQEVVFFTGVTTTTPGQCVKVVKAFVADGGR